MLFQFSTSGSEGETELCDENAPIHSLVTFGLWFECLVARRNSILTRYVPNSAYKPSCQGSSDSPSRTSRQYPACRRQVGCVEYRLQQLIVAPEVARFVVWVRVDAGRKSD